MDAFECPVGALPSTRCPLCTRGEQRCSADGGGIQRCGDDGLSFVDITSCNVAVGELCLNARCVIPCDEAAQSHRYQGCEFYAVGTLNSVLGHEFSNTTRDDFPFAVAVTNPWPVAVQITFEGGGLGSPIELSLPSFGAQVVTLPWLIALAEGGNRDAPASLMTFSCVNGVVMGASPCVCRQVTASCFRWCDRGQHGTERRVKNALTRLDRRPRGFSQGAVVDEPAPF